MRKKRRSRGFAPSKIILGDLFIGDCLERFQPSLGGTGFFPVCEPSTGALGYFQPSAGRRTQTSADSLPGFQAWLRCPCRERKKLEAKSPQRVRAFCLVELDAEIRVTRLAVVLDSSPAGSHHVANREHRRSDLRASRGRKASRESPPLRVHQASDDRSPALLR